MHPEHKLKGGFTLLEIIISIAALSLISVFILEMFMSSANLNNRARDTDKAMAAAVTAIENLKRFDSIEEYKLFDSRGRVIEESAALPEIITVYYYYDNDFNTIVTGGDITNARYTLQMDVVLANEHVLEQDVQTQVVGAAKNGTLCSIDVSVDDKGLTLAELSAKKYFYHNYMPNI